MRSVTFSAVGVAFGVAFFSVAAGAAPCLPPVSELPQVVFPLDGETVPTNGTFLLRKGGVVGLVGSVSGDLASHVAAIDVDNGFEVEPFIHVVADGGLPAGEQVQLQVDGVAVVSVLVDTAPDNDAPPAPGLSTGGRVSAGSCVPFGAIDVSAGGDARVFIARVDDDPGFVDGSVLDGLGVNRVVVAGEANSRASVHVAGVDVAGHVSAASVTDVDLDAGDTGGLPSCCVGGPFIAVLLPVLRRRRQRRFIAPSTSST